MDHEAGWVIADAPGWIELKAMLGTSCPKCGVTVTDQTPSAFYVNHDERCGGPLEEPCR